MSKILVLEKDVVEQIAAGEVIDRPSAIVKELLENAIDAGASRIDIQIEGGGLNRIRISDNGDGIEKDDIPFAILRHATSKIKASEDLYAISTMGFRGEALASIAAVSHFTLSSSTVGDGMGWQITTRGTDETSELTPTAQLKGTTVLCENLFFNLPARKKFLKSEKAEAMAIAKVVEQVILAFPTIHFSCTIHGKKKYDIPAVQNLRMRIAQIAGDDMAFKLVQCRGETENASVEIFISPPELAQARPPFQNLYVNLRRINSNSATQSIRQSYSNFISSHLKPNWFCYLDIDPVKIDVNVHPTKAELKFDNEREIFSLIYRTVENALRKNNTPKPHTEEEEVTLSYPKTEEPKRGKILSFSGVEGDSFLSKSKPQPAKNLSATQTSIPLLSMNNSEERRGTIEEAHWESIPCFQIHKRYIISPVKDGMMLIDQHAAHERVLYEKILKKLESENVESQRLLFPVTMELGPFEKETLLSIRELFEKTGFDIQDFGGNTIAVAAVPANGAIKSTQVKDAIIEMLNQYSEENCKDLLADVHRRFAAAYACGAAVKFGHTLHQEEMNSLMNTLFATQNPHICPHGRPTIVRLTLDELQKRFLR